jgi:hypothetical protein
MAAHTIYPATGEYLSAASRTSRPRANSAPVDTAPSKTRLHAGAPVPTLNGSLSRQPIASSPMFRNEIARIVFSPVTTAQLGNSIVKARFAAALIVVSVARKHGDTLIRTLRKTYSDHFAEGCRDDEKLGEVLHKMDEPSLGKLLHDRERGKLRLHLSFITTPPKTGWEIERVRRSRMLRREAW